MQEETRIVDKKDEIFYVIAEDQTDAELCVLDFLEKKLSDEEKEAQEPLEIVLNYKFYDKCGNHRVQGYYQKKNN